MLQVPLDKKNYKDPINPCVKCCQAVRVYGRKYGAKCVLLPVLICLHIFQDKESEDLVREQEAR